MRLSRQNFHVLVRLWAVTSGVHLHEGASVNLRLQLATWPKKMAVKTAVPWSGLAELWTRSKIARAETGRQQSEECSRQERTFSLFREELWRTELLPRLGAT